MKPLSLSSVEPFAIGGRRVCYVHPHDPSRCVKVLRKDQDRFLKAGRTLVPSFLRREYDNNADEHRALARVARLVGDDYRYLPRCYGFAPTDLGPGLVLDLMRDADGRISRSVREALRDGVSLDGLKPGYDAMVEYFIRHGVVTRAILDHNLVAQEMGDGSYRMVLIDGYGDRVWLPIRSLIPSARRATARRRAEEGWERIVSTAEHLSSGADWDRSRWGQGILDHRGEPAAHTTSKGHTA